MEFLTIFTIGFIAAVAVVLTVTTSRRYKEQAAWREAAQQVEREVFRAYASEVKVRVPDMLDENDVLIPAHDETSRVIHDDGVRAALAKLRTL